MYKEINKLKYNGTEYHIVGVQGPMGPQGPQGPQGEPGPSVDLTNYVTNTALETELSPILSDIEQLKKDSSIVGDLITNNYVTMEIPEESVVLGYFVDGQTADSDLKQVAGLKYSGDKKLFNLPENTTLINPGRYGAVTTLDRTYISTSRISASIISIDLSHLKSNLSTLSFEGCLKLKTINWGNIDLSNVTNISSMFRGCHDLTSIDLTPLNTIDVFYMNGMFYGCSSLQSLDLTPLYTGLVNDMNEMFGSCTSLQSLDLSNFDTSNVKNMTRMFNSCTSLQSLDLSNFDTSNVTNMVQMFWYCTSLQSLDLSNFNTSNVTNMYGMFNDCRSLQSLDLSNFNTSNVTDMRFMFDGCSSLQSLDLSNFDISNVTSSENMFSDCTKLNHIKCKQAFKDWCINNASSISLPAAMQEGGTGTWEIV